MPRPPILEPVDYRSLWENGKDYKQWLAIAESKENADKMDARRASIQVSESHKAQLRALAKPVHVLAIAEDWCGDVHLHAPVIARLEEESGGKVKVRFIAREDSHEAFKRYLTNGGEAIPKFIFFSDAFVEVGNWGPMPEACRKVIARGKGAGNVKAARERVSKMYESDPNGVETQRELIGLIETAAATFV